MALGIRTAHTFTFRQLYAKLCQQHCDSGCGKPAPYLDVFTISRRCLWVGGGKCDNRQGPCDAKIISKRVWSTTTPSFPINRPEDATPLIFPGDVSNFHAIPYRIGRHSHLTWPSTRTGDLELTHYDYAEAQKFLLSKGYRLPEAYYPQSGSNSWRLSVVFAPWTATTGAEVVHGAFCPKCWDSEAQRCEALKTQIEASGELSRPVPRHLMAAALSKRQDRMASLALLIPHNMAFGTDEWLARHVVEKHGG